MMRLSAKDQSNISLGTITNFISVDIQHNRSFWCELQCLIFCPLMISSSVYFLSREVGFKNTYMGFIVLLLFMIFNVFMSRIYQRFEAKQMKFKDDRLKLVTDVLNGIKFVKFYGWELSVQKWVCF
jgi:ATP-binding cassette subfamily C (CFTR/MRP) protein 1